MNDGDRGRMDAQPQPEEQSKFPLSDIEAELGELRDAASILGHVATSDYDATTEDLLYIQEHFVAHHDRLEALWKQVWEERVREQREHEAELAAAKARTAPGSKAELERVAGLWGVLAAAADVVLEWAKEAMPAGTRALAGDATGLPPAASGRV
jgi:hypothetical protein